VDSQKGGVVPAHSSHRGLQSGFQISPESLLGQLKQMLAALPDDERKALLSRLDDKPES